MYICIYINIYIYLNTGNVDKIMINKMFCSLLSVSNGFYEVFNQMKPFWMNVQFGNSQEC